MKYGLLYYKDTDNIGDDIQAYAASQFLPRIDYMIDREKLNDFVPDEKEYVKTIMNAWYVHDKFNFGFSPYIYPLLISMFFKKFPYEAGITVGLDYINENIKNYLKKYGPVGSRDIHTLKSMKKLNIDSYFSGCMTLTINKFNGVVQGDYIVVVGLKKDEINYIKSITNRKVINFVQDVKKGSFADETWEERKKRVEDTLKLYQGAHMVITNKLHCSLPCLALETPVLLLYDTSFAENKDRIGSYLPYLNHIKREELKKSNIDIEHPKANPKKYLKLRNELISRCEKFVAKDAVLDKSELPDIDIYKQLNEKSNIEKKVILKFLNQICGTYEKECIKSSKMYDKLTKLENENMEIKQELQAMKNSRGWKLLEKLRKIR